MESELFNTDTNTIRFIGTWRTIIEWPIFWSLGNDFISTLMVLITFDNYWKFR